MPGPWAPGSAPPWSPGRGPESTRGLARSTHDCTGKGSRRARWPQHRGGCLWVSGSAAPAPHPLPHSHLPRGHQGTHQAGVPRRHTECAWPQRAGQPGRPRPGAAGEPRFPAGAQGSPHGGGAARLPGPATGDSVLSPFLPLRGGRVLPSRLAHSPPRSARPAPARPPRPHSAPAITARRGPGAGRRPLQPGWGPCQPGSARATLTATAVHGHAPSRCLTLGQTPPRPRRRSGPDRPPRKTGHPRAGQRLASWGQGSAHPGHAGWSRGQGGDLRGGLPRDRSAEPSLEKSGRGPCRETPRQLRTSYSCKGFRSEPLELPL